MYGVLKSRESYTQKASAFSAAMLNSKISLDFKSIDDDRHLWVNPDADVDPCPFVTVFNRCKHNPCTLAVADEEGFISILHPNRPRYGKNITRWEAHENAIFDAHFLNDDHFLATASGDRTIQISDVETHTTVSTLNGHIGSVKSIRSQRQNHHILISGSRDGSVRFWDTRRRNDTSVKSLVCLHNVHAKSVTSMPRYRSTRISKEYHKGVSSALFLGDDRVAVSGGATDGLVKFWDIRKLNSMLPQPIACLGAQNQTFSCSSSLSQHHQFDHRGIYFLDIDSTYTKLLAGCTRNKIVLYDAIRPMEAEPAVLSGHIVSSFYVRSGFSPDGRFVISSSSDCNIYIWDTQRLSSTPLVLYGHDGEVNGISWSPCSTRIASCSDDGTVRIWRQQTVKTPTRLCEIKDKCNMKCSKADTNASVASPKARLPSGQGSSRPLRSSTLFEAWSH